MARNPDLTYGSHLQLDRILGAQAPVSESHDEILFLIQHQTSELWLRLVLVEIDAARARLAARDLRGGGKALRRAALVLDHLVASWDVLRSLTPLDFMTFRGKLGIASGFQSWQYRLVEFAFGNRVPEMLEPHRGATEALALLEAELARPSLYQVVLGVLEERLQTGLPASVFERDRPYRAHEEVRDAWAEVYRDAVHHADLFDLAEQLVEIEDRFRCWRFNHVTTVERVIGSKAGTGGTSGVSYLRRMLEVELFPELWAVRSSL